MMTGTNEMSMTLYDFSVPIFGAMLSNLSKVLAKAEQNALERKIAPEVFIQGRIAPDMLPLVNQIRIATDNAKGCGCRLSGREVPRFADEEKTFADLQERISKTKDLLKSLDRKEFEGAETRTIELKAGPRELKFNGTDYLNRFAMPNFQFHTTMAYAILRHNGVPLGKLDYLGG